MAVIPAASTEYLHVPVTATPAGTSLTGVPVKMAVVAHRTSPAVDEWRTASWTDGTARILIGPGSDLLLAAGDYRVWIAIDLPGAEHVIRQSGILTVT